ncbi:MAG: Rieske (2Fe-2S) protein [bacterium]|nr:Rieske (2Fe-2S) protein [Planctomycetota bacterium]HIL50990.1 Rieske (2Fe-2S) protein [Planctomycetota bacterium]
MNEAWIPVCPTADFEVGKAKVVKGEAEGRRYQIAVFQSEPGRFDAVDNLCPHEGYPLVQGYVKDCVLTCAWHNFKFRLQDGACIKGDEDVAVYATRITAGQVEVRLVMTEKAVDVPAALESLGEGLLRGQQGRVARDVVRLLQADVSPATLLLFVAKFDAERAEWGTNHALAVAADMLGEVSRFDGVEAALPIMQAMDNASEANRRRPRRNLVEAVAVTGDADAVGSELRALIEDEDHPGAEAWLLGALQAGFGRDDLERWLLGLCCDHFIGFGHPLIYVTKAFDLLDAVGFEHAPDLLPALLFRIVNSTREDILPPMEFLEDHFAAQSPQFEAWSQNKGPLEDAAGLREALLDGNKHDACERVTRALEQAADPVLIVNEIVRAASERMLRFDYVLGNSDEVQEGWLDLTHGLTYAHAVRITFERYACADRLRLLFYAAHFVQRTGPLDLPERSAAGPLEATTLEALSLEDIAAAVGSRETDRAVALVRCFLGQGGDVDALRNRFVDYLLSDKLVRPIVVAHGLKTCLAAFAETAALDDDPLPVLAFTRFASSPIRERSVSRSVHEAIRFLRDGRPPKRLTS